MNDTKKRLSPDAEFDDPLVQNTQSLLEEEEYVTNQISRELRRHR